MGFLKKIFRKKQIKPTFAIDYQSTYENKFILLKPILAYDYNQRESKEEKEKKDKNGREISLERFAIVAEKVHMMTPSNDLCTIEVREDIATSCVSYEYKNMNLLVCKQEFKQYRIPYTIETLTLYRNNEKVILDSIYINFVNSRKFTQKCIPMLIDIFHNFDEEIIQAFGNGIFETIKNFVELKGDLFRESGEMSHELIEYLEYVYKTILSIGEYKTYYPSAKEYLEIKNAQELEKIRLEKLKQMERRKEQDRFIQELKLRKELLSEFNRPMNFKEEN